MAMRSRSLSPQPTPHAWLTLGQGTQRAIDMVVGLCHKSITQPRVAGGHCWHELVDGGDSTNPQLGHGAAERGQQARWDSQSLEGSMVRGTACQGGQHSAGGAQALGWDLVLQCQGRVSLTCPCCNQLLTLSLSAL